VEKEKIIKEFFIYSDTRIYSPVGEISRNFQKQLIKELNISAKKKADQLKG